MPVEPVEEPSTVTSESWPGEDLSATTWTRVALVADLRGSTLTGLDPGSTRLVGTVITVDQAVAVAGRSASTYAQRERPVLNR